MIHPLAVDHLEQNHALERSHYRHAVFVDSHEFLTLVINLVSALNKLFLCVLAVKAVREVLGRGQPAEELLTQSGYVPVGVGERLRAIEIYGLGDALVEHLEYNGLEVLAVEHLVALLVDKLTLAVHDIVEAQDALTHREVARLDALLRALDNI